MMNLLAKPWELIKALFGLAFPMAVGKRADSAGAWVARSVLLAAVLAGLTLLNRWERVGLTGWIQGRIASFWLPLFAFCAYAMVWLGWLLYRVLNIDVGPVTTEFPDIDHAWNQALEALGRAEIHLEDTPLFLILGWTAGGEDPLFHAARIKAQVKQVPRDPAEPLHVTANRDAIWVSCAGASVLGQQNPSLEGRGGADGALDTLLEQPADPLTTQGPADGRTLSIEDFMASARSIAAAKPSAAHNRTVIDSERYVARLRYFCRLIARDRQGFCPINGVLIVLPITAANPRNGLDELAAACKADLVEAFDVFRIRCPVLVLISDLEKLPGFSDLVERLHAGQAAKRMGQRFPLAPDLDTGLVPARIEDSVSWIGNSLFPSMVYSLFGVEPGPEDVTEVVRTNSQLYRFLSKMRDRQERIARLVRDSIPALPREPILFGGCYFAGTGIDAVTEQAFASGVLLRLIQDQDNVTWTSDALLEDARFLRLARGLKVALLVVIGLGVAAIVGLTGWIGWRALFH